MITPPYNPKRSSSSSYPSNHLKVRTFTQRGEAEDPDEKHNPRSANALPHREKRRKTGQQDIINTFKDLNLPSLARLSHAGTGSFDAPQMDVDIDIDIDTAMSLEMDETSTISLFSPPNGTTTITAASGWTGTEDCAIPPPPPHHSTSPAHRFSAFVPFPGADPLLATNPEPYAESHHVHQYHAQHQSFSRTSFPIYEDPNDIELQEIRVNVFAPWDGDKENIVDEDDERAWTVGGGPVEEQQQQQQQQYEDSTAMMTSYYYVLT
ncbi:uncharacterized protein BO97DRAFT_424193 [Aspergillus homomorphus CBS 101889]|uniref:Uncharacterized protein n=1 Tax=Aspergillus homomorphus (strain CBS 101889) TaxID=1450537 RepID=A0A395I011_ASPHC|nr:hypothetical protein BO97DRAFT_424193 [Aspergillus homomorphus CBS 101889]RAL13019.1 hypothetical protein BO97DRAFT_424193 [Aspergillus homomorphus CBS 101889]